MFAPLILEQCSSFLAEHFPLYPIFHTKVKQGFPSSSFFIHCSNARLVKGLKDKFSLSFSFSILFFHPLPYSAFEQVFHLLPFIGGSLFHPSDLSVSLFEDYAEFSFSATFSTRSSSLSPRMNDIQQEVLFHEKNKPFTQI